MLAKMFRPHDKEFYHKMVAIALPIALQNFINFGVSMMDTLMVGKIGEIQLSAASAANQMGFMFMILSFGVANGCGVLTAQYWGRGDREKVGSTIAFMLRVVMVLSILFTLVAYFAPGFVLRLFIPDPEVIAEGVLYLKIIAFSFLFSGITNSTIGILRSIGTVRISLVVYSISLVVNTIINYVLIFGKFGFPAMGIRGAAVGTLISRIIEATIMVVFLFKYEHKLKLRLRDMRKLDSTVVKAVIAFSSPVLINEIFWSSGSLIINSVIGHLGREVLAASSICMVLFQLSQAAIYGLSNAAAAITGNTIGAGQHELARERANCFVAISVIAGVLAAALMFAARYPLIAFYRGSLSAAAIGYAYELSAVTAVMMVMQTISMITMMGVLRGGGDTRFVMVIDVIFMWTIAIPLGALAGLVWHWPVWVVYVVLKSEDIFKSLIAVWRILRGRWMRDITRKI